jgi:hypothetical protein
MFSSREHWPEMSVFGTAEITVALLKEGNKIHIDAGRLTINYVALNDKKLRFNYDGGDADQALANSDNEFVRFHSSTRFIPLLPNSMTCKSDTLASAMVNRNKVFILCQPSFPQAPGFMCNK